MSGEEVTREVVMELFNLFDVDGDGKVEWKEFESMLILGIQESKND